MNYNDLINKICLDQQPCLIHGMAGTGKSTLIREISAQVWRTMPETSPNWPYGIQHRWSNN
jgi:MoxR-like ATPase